jgi:hypothetical protein
MATRLKVVLTLSDFPLYMIGGATGIEPSCLSRYSRGRRQLPERHLIRLAAFFDLHPDDLRGEADLDWAANYIARVKKQKVDA